MEITVLSILAVLILLSALFGAMGKYPWGWSPFAILVGIYCLLQQFPVGK